MIVFVIGKFGNDLQCRYNTDPLDPSFDVITAEKNGQSDKTISIEV